MTTEILMPELGESVHEGTVSRWLKKVGDVVKEDEPVVEIMTDKVNTELQSPASGVLVSILIPEGENVKVFEALGLIGEEADIATSGNGAKPAPAAKAPETLNTAGVEGVQTAAAPIAHRQSPIEPPSGKRWYTPLVRSMARESGLSESDLASISGTGEGGRVTKRDIQAFIASGPQASSQAPPQPAIGPAQTTPSAPPNSKLQTPSEVINLVGIRKAIADAMTRAHEIPSVSTVTQVDVSKMVEFRKLNKDSFQQMYSVKLTYTPFFIKAATEALLENPYVNSSLGADGKLTINHAINMGIAVALGDGSQGLVVPVIRDCHKKSIVDIARELEAIAVKAREGKLEIADYQGATFTLTNPGTYGALFGTPMIPAGLSGILGTYAINETVVARDGWFGIKPIMHLVLSYDHRVVDGMLAGKFLKAVRDKLEGFDFFR